ncbi:aquaporin Z [Brevibacterium sanguinis]|uniref:Aquaporin Z n=2 Tax=Brevibacterium TaxID=1696 RepID=A0A366INN6_9MICO|nr:MULTISPECIES: aquaporin Z [Brevibacterium]RBP67260.1 aquaporin Z [Brevibacterium sanguinis]RBP73785.1 aquaporin Z [Brevibacterium celere]
MATDAHPADIESLLPSTGARWGAEALGTFLLVLGGVGTAVLAGEHVGFLGVALAFGLTVVVGAYSFGPVSGGHFNPAVTVGLATAGRFAWKDVPGYVIAQVVGGLVASSLLFLIALGRDGADLKNFASNGYGDASPDGYGLLSVALVEIILTAVFVIVILGATAPRSTPAAAGLTIGLSLTLIHLISIPVSNTSVNPARSIASAIYGGGESLMQLWAFLVFPIIGALLGGLVFKPLLDGVRKTV